MTEQQFQSEIGRAETICRLTTNPIEGDYLVSYIRGLRRTYHGENFGTEEEHKLRLSLTSDVDGSAAERPRIPRGLEFGEERTEKP